MQAADKISFWLKAALLLALAGIFFAYEAHAYPIWSGGGSGGSSSGGIARSVNSVSMATNAGATPLTDYVYLITGTSTLTLPTAVNNTDLYTVCNVDATHTITIATTSAQTINNSSTVTESVQYTCLNFISNNANWIVN